MTTQNNAAASGTVAVTQIQTSTTHSGPQKLGDIVTFTLFTDQAVTATGSPRLILSNGGFATYSGLDGQGHPQFAYTIAAGQDAGNLGLDGLDLNGGRLGVAGQTSFGSATNFAVGSGPSTLLTTDLNNDGKADLIVGNNGGSGSHSVSMKLGVGDGTFTDAPSLSIPGYPTSIAAADINGDGKTDLLISDTSGVLVRLGQGDGTFTAGTTVGAGSSNPQSVVVADVNNDGKLDLLAHGTGGIAVRLGNGDETFTSAAAVSIGSYSVVTADLNNDGKIDLLSTDGSSRVYVRMGNGDGTFTTKADVAGFYYHYFVTTADVNGDGKLDLIVENAGYSNLSVRLGNGDGTFAATSVQTIPGASTSDKNAVSATDVNNDGRVDLVFPGGDTVKLWTGNGDGTFTSAGALTAGSGPQPVATVDLNGDGKVDIVVANNSSNNVSAILNTSTSAKAVDGTSIPSAAGSQTGLIVDATPPSVINITPSQSGPTGTTTLTHTVVFSESVSGVDASDFTLTTTGTASATIGTVSGSGTTWTVALTGASGDGTLRLDLNGSNTGIVDAAGNAAGGFTSGSTVTLDHTAPAGTVTAATVAANAASTTFTVSFPESVAGVDPSDFVLAATGTAGGAIAAVSGSGGTYTVTVEGIHGAGTLGLALASDAAIIDAAGNNAANVSNTTTHQVDRAAPIVGVNTGAIVAEGGSATITAAQLVATDTSAGAVTYTVTDATTGGAVYRDGLVLLVGSTFTQADLDANLISFRHFGGEAPSASFGFQVSDSLGNTLANQTFALNVTAVDDAPVLAVAPARIAEDAAPGALVATLGATDADDSGSSLRYAITGGNDDGLFAIDPITGAITLASGKALDYETAHLYDLKVRATDAAGLFDEKTLTVQVGNLNEATAITATASTTGTLKAGDTVTFTLTMETDVPASDTPALRLNNGASASYAGLDPSGHATFTYTVTAGDDVANLSVTGLDLNGGSFDQPASLVITPAAPVSVGANPFAPVLADVDGDGKLDLLVSNTDSDRVSVRLGDGMGGFGGTTEIPVGAYPLGVAVVDVDGDGKLDLRTANAYGSSVSVRLGDGMGGFGGATEVDVGVTPLDVAVADVNGDGKLDLLAANADSATVSVRLGNGMGGFGGTTEVAVGALPQSVALVDVDGDGKLDLLAANSFGNSVSVRLGDGMGGFSGGTEVGDGVFPARIATADVNGDGKLDFVVTNFDSGTVSVLLNTSTAARPFAASTVSGATSGAVTGFAIDTTAPALTGTQTALASGTEDRPYTVTKAQLLDGWTGAGGQSLSVTGLTASSGTVTDNHDGTYTIAPLQNANGPVTLTYTVTDGTYAVAASRGFTVDAVNDAPTATLDTATVTQRLTITGSVLGNDTDPDRDVLTVTAAGIGATAGSALNGEAATLEGRYGTLTLRPDGSYSYAANREGTLAVGDSAVDTFHYAIADGHDGTAEADLSITVTGSDTGDAGANTFLLTGSDLGGGDTYIVEVPTTSCARPRTAAATR